MKKANTMRVTMKDIAREAKLSVSAVSLVLNNQPCRVSEENKELIRSIARKYNYSANQIARSLVTKKTKTLGLIMPDIENIFFSSLAKCLEEHCRREGYVLMITNSNDQYEDDIELLNLLVGRGIDGLFLIVSNESYQNKAKFKKYLKSLTIPYVMVDRIYEELSCDKVFFDNRMGAYLAVKHLLEHGHRRIGCVTSTTFSQNGMARLDGYLHALKEFGCPINPDYIVEGDYRIKSGYRAGEKLLQTDVTAAFISNDMMSLGFLKKLHEEGVQIPRDFSIVSYDNTLAPFLLEIDLDVVEQDVKELGQRSFDLLLESLKPEGRSSHQEICLLPKLIVKNSVRKIREGEQN